MKFRTSFAVSILLALVAAYFLPAPYYVPYYMKAMVCFLPVLLLVLVGDVIRDAYKRKKADSEKQ